MLRHPVFGRKHHISGSSGCADFPRRVHFEIIGSSSLLFSHGKKTYTSSYAFALSYPALILS